MRLSVSFGCLALIIAAAAGCSRGTQAEVSAQAQQPGGRGGNTPAVPVSVAQAITKSMPVTLNVIGTVDPANTVSIHAQVTGQLTTVSFEEGDNVQKGAVLFELDRRPLEAAVKQAEAALQKDIAQAQNAQAVSNRTADLAARGIATQEQVQTAKAGADALAATIEADRAAVDNAKIQLQFATITAPITGRTGSLMVHAGTLVRANDTTPLVIINQITPINVEFAVPEAQLAELRRYQAQKDLPVSVATPDDPDNTSKGRIIFIDNAVDQTTGTIRAKASFPNADRRLWPGQYVNVTVTFSTDQAAVVVPSAAVQASQQGSYVVVIKDDKTAEMRNVVVKRTVGEETIIASGVSANETVVTDGHLRLVPGSRVSIKPALGGPAQ